MAFAVGSLPPSSRRDRTSEFHAIADRLRKTQASHGSGANGSATASNGHHHHESSRLLGPEPSGSAQSEFNRRASRIGLSIHQTSQKLSKLTKCTFTCKFIYFLRLCWQEVFDAVFFLISIGSWRCNLLTVPKPWYILALWFLSVLPASFFPASVKHNRRCLAALWGYLFISKWVFQCHWVNCCSTNSLQSSIWHIFCGRPVGDNQLYLV
jgi:hypothetical protein